jgi:hypothetical protein
MKPRRLTEPSPAGRASAGQTLVLFALLLPVLAGITGLALDAGHLYFQRRHLQAVADAAALTGAQVANFNVDTPAIRADGAAQARANARTNGLADGEITVNLPPSAAAGVYAGKADYIEVVVTRSVPHAFMGLFGQWSTTLQARAVARCVKPGYGDPAVLALSDDAGAITFNGGGSSAVRIDGDIISNGGIDPNGAASHFQIDGAAYAMSQPAATNLTTTNGSYGTDSNVALLPVPDPVEQGEYAQPPTVSWPNFAGLSNGTATVCRDRAGVEVCDTDSGNVTVGSNERAVFTPGKYNTLRIQGDATLLPGIYSVESLDLGAGGTLTDLGLGVLLHVRGPAGLEVDVSGGAEFTLTAISSNTWMNIVLYVEYGDVDMTGNGNRELNGSVYAPAGNVAIAGDGGDAIVNGQVIANTVEFSGNGPAVNYASAGSKPTFGPILVNTPD